MAKLIDGFFTYQKPSILPTLVKSHGLLAWEVHETKVELAFPKKN
jgi:hypothetical protein